MLWTNKRIEEWIDKNIQRYPTMEDVDAAMRQVRDEYELGKEDKLKPCPICGCDQAKIVEMDAYWWVMCQMCGTRLPRTRPELARAMWNKLDR